MTDRANQSTSTGEVGRGRLTREQAAIIGLYTGISCGPFVDIHILAEKLLGEPILTHEFAAPGVWERLKELVKPQFIALCAEKDTP
jgi:hypothetical protein